MSSVQISTATFLGCVPFTEARKIQEELVSKRIRGECEDTILFLEHPATVTLGKSAKHDELGLSLADWKARGVDVVQTTRGGGVTYHDRGQLIIYPVISLRERAWGVRYFVKQGLELINQGLTRFGVNGYVSLNPAGVWIPSSLSSDTPRGHRKIASVGLRIVSGVTNHGFSVNINSPMEPFSLFSPCRLGVDSITSLAREKPKLDVDLVQIYQTIAEAFCSIKAG